jgi:peptidoglycan hydrolase CwlO-like protein
MKKTLEEANKKIEALEEKNKNLQDEVDSLWAMMDEITKSDIQNFSHLLDELKADVITRTLMITKKVAEC